MHLEQICVVIYHGWIWIEVYKNFDEFRVISPKTSHGQIMKLAITTDSRCRGLHDFIKEFNGNIVNESNVELSVRGGAKLGQLKDHLDSTCTRLLARPADNRRFIPILIGGICDISIRSSYGALSYKNTDTVTLVKSDLDAIWESYPTCITATIPPVDLNKWNEKHAPTKLAHTNEQVQLEKDTEEINQYIRQRNDRTGLPHINLDKAVHTYSLKRKRKGTHPAKRTSKFISKDLYDGVHANNDLKKKWFQHICTVIEQYHTTN